MRKCTKCEKSNHWPCWPGGQSDQDQSTGSSGLGFWIAFRASFSHPFPLVLQEFCRFSCQWVIFEDIAVDWGLWIYFFWRLEAKVLDLGWLLFLPHVTVIFSTIPAHLGFRLWVLLSLLASSSFVSVFLMARMRESVAFRAQGKRPTKPS